MPLILSLCDLKTSAPIYDLLDVSTNREAHAIQRALTKAVDRAGRDDCHWHVQSFASLEDSFVDVSVYVSLRRQGCNFFDIVDIIPCSVTKNA